MKIIGKVLESPAIWALSQAIFGCDVEKRRLYRSVFRETGRLLDFGCANGNTFPAFDDFEYYGVDINTRLINDARKKYASFSNAHFINADMLDKPFKPEYFDYVLFSCTGHHLEDRVLYSIMKELDYVLKPGGKLYFFDTIIQPGKDSLFLKLMNRLDQGKFIRDESTYRNIAGSFSQHLNPRRTDVLKISGTFLPQPAYFYAEFEKI